jgi:hypothetical protein
LTEYVLSQRGSPDVERVDRGVPRTRTGTPRLGQIGDILSPVFAPRNTKRPALQTLSFTRPERFELPTFGSVDAYLQRNCWSDGQSSATQCR